MQTLLNDIELDIQELKCLMQAISKDANPALRTVAKRNIQQMRMRLDELQKSLDELIVPVHQPSVTIVQDSPVDSAVDTESFIIPLPSSILAERIKPATDLRRAISLNDSFRFTRELFNGDAARMNEVVHQLGEASDLEHAMAIFTAEVHPEEENEAATDLMELLKKYFS